MARPARRRAADPVAVDATDFLRIYYRIVGRNWRDRRLLLKVLRALVGVAEDSEYWSRLEAEILRQYEEDLKLFPR